MLKVLKRLAYEIQPRKNQVVFH
uniref:Uncharacterized protein n=1 Tax=Arundo donax TaxID=35708 RepID=A0A0A8XY83_ARUDO